MGWHTSVQVTVCLITSVELYSCMQGDQSKFFRMATYNLPNVIPMEYIVRARNYNFYYSSNGIYDAAHPFFPHTSLCEAACADVNRTQNQFPYNSVYTG